MKDELDKLERFVNALDRGEMPPQDTLHVGAMACVEKAQRLQKLKGGRPRKYVYYDDAALTVVAQYQRGKLSYQEAADAVQELLGLDDDRHAKRYIRKLKPEAEKLARIMSRLNMA